VGFTTRRVLATCRQILILENDAYTENETKNKLWYKAAEEDFRRNRENAANGSLMRNAIIPCITEDLSTEKAIEFSVLQSMTTHMNPLAVLTCVLQTIIIRRALLDANNHTDGVPRIAAPTMNDIRSIIENEWHDWLKSVQNNSDPTIHEACADWIRIVGTTEIKLAEARLLEELDGFENFDPYSYMYKGVSGYCVLTLKISLWALYWSFDRSPEKLQAPKHLPIWPFDNQPKGFDSIMFVVLIGADADTYGATAGPMLAAYHSTIRRDFIDTLWERKTIEDLVDF
jgi:ADP-ribosylglycohydrolase